MEQLNLEELTNLFRSAGAPNPEQWARSQVDEGINQLHRFLFLREAWRSVATEDDHAWIELAIKSSLDGPGEPYSAIGASLQRLQSLGAHPEDLTDIVRGMQAQLLFSLCCQMDDGSPEEAAFSKVGWALVETNAAGEPTERRISGLHESVLVTDPTGREMQPRLHRR